MLDDLRARLAALPRTERSIVLANVLRYEARRMTPRLLARCRLQLDALERLHLASVRRVS